MLCCDTGDSPIIDMSKMMRIPMTVEEACEISEEFQTVRNRKGRNAEICIIFINGTFDQLKTIVTRYRARGRGRDRR